MTINSTKLQTNLDVINAPVESLVFGVQMTFRVAALILLAALILATFLWWLEQRPESNSLSLLPSPLVNSENLEK